MTESTCPCRLHHHPYGSTQLGTSEADKLPPGISVTAWQVVRFLRPWLCVWLLEAGLGIGFKCQPPVMGSGAWEGSALNCCCYSLRRESHPRKSTVERGCALPGESGELLCSLPHSSVRPTCTVSLGPCFPRGASAPDIF